MPATRDALTPEALFMLQTIARTGSFADYSGGAFRQAPGPSGCR